MKIGRFLDSTPAWRSDDADERRAAIAADKVPPADLESMAATDADPAVRLAAIDALTNAEFILSLAHASDGEQRRRAAVRWTQIIAGGKSPEAAIDAVSAPAILAETARSAPTPELRLHAIDRIDDAEALMSVLADDNHSRVHQACAERIDAVPHLEWIRKRFQDRDKGVYQIARNKLSALKSEIETAESIREECEDICQSLASLAKSQHEPNLERRLDVVEMRWQEASSAHPEVAGEFEARASESLLAIRERLAAEAARVQAISDAANRVLARQQEIKSALENSVEPLASLPETLQSLRAEWPSGLATDDRRLHDYHEFMESAERLVLMHQQIEGIDPETGDLGTLRAALAEFRWPTDLQEPPKAGVLRERLNALIDADEAEKAQRDQRITTTRNQLSEFEKKIEDGNLKGSNRAHSTIAKSVDTHRDILPADLIEEFGRLTKRLTELRDWHRFVTNPKRAELAEQMESLANDTDMHPPKKAKQIKSLQDAWKALGPSDNREAQELWSRFKAASDKAYEPCAQFFDHQKQLRAENLKGREAICEELEAFNEAHDWTNPDYKAVGSLISRSLKAWREAGEVPRARFKKVSERFTAALEPLQERLSAEHERNRQQKAALIERVAAFADDADTPLQSLIDSTKQAQRDWQQIGPAERRKEQKLWKAFRKECDRLFARRDEARDEARKEANSARGECGQVIDRLKQRIAAGDIERGELRQFRDEFDAASKQAGKGTPRKAFQAAIKQAERSIEQRAVQNQRQELQEARRRAELCRSVEDGETTANAVDAEWEGETEISGELAERLDARRQAAADLTDEQREKNLERAALLCVRAEILAGIDSPEEAQSLRMQYQVERLNRELSQGQKDHRSPAEQMRELQIDWYCLGGLPSGSEGLRQRFRTAEEKLGG